MLFSRETLVNVYDELLPLVAEHYIEIAWRKDNIPLDIDRERYIQMNEAGTFLCYVGREGHRIVAYACFFIAPHPHYKSTIFAVNDIIFLLPVYRHKGNATDLINYCEADLKALGCQVMTLHVKPQLDFGPLCEHLGFDPGDRIWQKWLGD